MIFDVNVLLVKCTLFCFQLVSETEVLSDKHATADQDFRAEMERWNETKKRDLKALFLEIAERHIKFYEQVK